MKKIVFDFCFYLVFRCFEILFFSISISFLYFSYEKKINTTFLSQTMFKNLVLATQDAEEISFRRKQRTQKNKKIDVSFSVIARVISYLTS